MTDPHRTSPLTHLYQEEIFSYTIPLVVVLPKAWNTYGVEEQTLLVKILTSVNVNIDAVQIAVLPSVELTSLCVYQPTRVLIFGCDTQEDLPLYKETPAAGFRVIRADDLSRLDDQKKKNLWIALRQMFGV